MRSFIATLTFLYGTLEALATGTGVYVDEGTATALVDTGQSKMRLHVTLGFGLQPISEATVELTAMAELVTDGSAESVVLAKFVLGEATELSELVVVVIVTLVATELLPCDVDEIAGVSGTAELAMDDIVLRSEETLEISIADDNERVVALVELAGALSAVTLNFELVSELIATLDIEEEFGVGLETSELDKPTDNMSLELDQAVEIVGELDSVVETSRFTELDMMMDSVVECEMLLDGRELDWLLAIAGDDGVEDDAEGGDDSGDVDVDVVIDMDVACGVDELAGFVDERRLEDDFDELTLQLPKPD